MHDVLDGQLLLDARGDTRLTPASLEMIDEPERALVIGSSTASGVGDEDKVGH